MRPLALLVGLVAVVAGCGATERVTAERIASAAERTAESGSARVELTVRDGESRFRLSGAVDLEARTAQLTFSGTRFGESADGELRLVGDVLYVRSPLLPAFVPGVEPWLSVPRPEHGRQGPLDELLPFPTVDPDELLSRLEGAAGEVTRLGDEEVRGARAEGYRFELDLARLAGRPGKEGAEATVPVEVWIDADDRVRRVAVEHDGKEATVDFFDFGADVEVEAPPRDEVRDLSALLDAILEGRD
jgi:hypothetical protein